MIILCDSCANYNPREDGTDAYCMRACMGDFEDKISVVPFVMDGQRNECEQYAKIVQLNLFGGEDVLG